MMIASQCIECPTGRGGPYNSTQGCGPHHDPERFTKGIPAKILSQDGSPQDYSPTMANGQKKEEEKHNPCRTHVREDEQTYKHEKECRGNHVSLIKNISEPAKSESPDDAEKGYAARNETCCCPWHTYAVKVGHDMGDH